MRTSQHSVLQLDVAEAALQRGECDTAVRSICAALLHFLQRVDVHRARALLPVGPFLECGVAFVTTQTGLRAEFRKAQFTRQDCQCMLTAAATFLQDPLQRTLCERVSARLQALSVRLMTGPDARWPQRVLLICLHGMRQGLRPWLPHAARRDHSAVLMIGLIMHEPLARAGVLLRRHSLQAELLCQRQHAAAMQVEPFLWPERPDYRRWLQRNPGSRVLVTLHMGDYRGAFACLAAEAEAGRRVLSLQREWQEDLSFQHQVDPRLCHKVLPGSAAAATAIVAALREGKTTLAILCDLGHRFGETEPVQLFGLPAQLVRGPALFAILGRAPLVPFVTFQCNGRDHIRMAPIIPGTLRAGESLAQGVQRLTSLLAAHVEEWVRLAPTQWRFLPHAAMYFSASMTGEPGHAH